VRPPRVIAPAQRVIDDEHSIVDAWGIPIETPNRDFVVKVDVERGTGW
jgi:hypothetical protein